jgi:hypothetical protein
MALIQIKRAGRPGCQIVVITGRMKRNPADKRADRPALREHADG